MVGFWDRMEAVAPGIEAAIDAEARAGRITEQDAGRLSNALRNGGLPGAEEARDACEAAEVRLAAIAERQGVAAVLIEGRLILMASDDLMDVRDCNLLSGSLFIA